MVAPPLSLYLPSGGLFLPDTQHSTGVYRHTAAAREWPRRRPAPLTRGTMEPARDPTRSEEIMLDMTDMRVVLHTRCRRQAGRKMPPSRHARTDRRTGR